jgi:DNA excision repair protein ERCC-4
MKIPAKLTVDQLTAIIDSREQLPWDLSPMRTKTGALETGDYSIDGLEHQLAIERKSLPDLLACCGRDRDRFARVVRRLVGLPHRLLVVECSWVTIQSGSWQSRIDVDAVVNSLLSWSATGLPFVLADNRKHAEDIARRFLFLSARRVYRRGRQLLTGVIDPCESTRAKTRK